MERDKNTILAKKALGERNGTTTGSLEWKSGIGRRHYPYYKDLEEYPLPSFKLIRLQWFLTRIIGMAGAGSDEELEFYPADEDDIELPELEEPEKTDTSLESIEWEGKAKWAVTGHQVESFNTAKHSEKIVIPTIEVIEY
ncbi:hypothetical protein B7463_g2288, partial [Scytalidium lignicola]